MNTKSKSVFTLIGILISAGIILWQQYNLNTKKNEDNIFTPPQWQGNHATLWSKNFHTNSQLFLLSRKLTFHKTPERTLSETPKGIYKENSTLYIFKAQHGELPAEKLVLIGAAHVQKKDQVSPTVHLNSDQLVFNSKLNTLTSNTLVKVSQKSNWMRGVGLTLYTKDQKLTLHKKVFSRYE